VSRCAETAKNNDHYGEQILPSEIFHDWPFRTSPSYPLYYNPLRVGACAARRMAQASC
jgi:hypothetical protein